MIPTTKHPEPAVTQEISRLKRRKAHARWHTLAVFETDTRWVDLFRFEGKTLLFGGKPYEPADTFKIECWMFDVYGLRATNIRMFAKLRAANLRDQQQEK